MSEIVDLLDRRKKLKAARRNWDDLWQELAEVLLPRRADFTFATRVDGEKRMDEVFDSVPMQARRGLATAIDGLLKPKTSRWFHLRASDDALNNDDEVKAWLEEVENRMFAAIYSRQAQFIQRSGEVDNDLVTFGTGILFVGENKQANGLAFRSFHLRDVALAENADGVVDTLFITITHTARQAEQKWGRENLGTKTQEALRNNQPDKEFEFVWVVMPRDDRDPAKRDNTNMPVASLVIDVTSQEIVVESGFHEFPFAVPRWDTTSGEMYGRSPGMIALPDAQTLQQMGKTLLIAGQKRADPPLWMTSDAVLSGPRTFPGGITLIDAAAARNFGRTPIGELTNSADIPVGREMQNDTREQVFGAFFRNVLQLPVDSPRMTATEVMERKEEFLRTIGPVFGQLESDYIGHVVERVFGIMFRAGAFPPPPEQVQGRDIRFEFQSPVQQARKQIEAAGFARALEMIGPLAQAQPEILDNFDGDAIARDMPDLGGFPLDWMRGEEQVEALRQSRSNQQSIGQTLEGGQQVAEIAQKAAPLLQGGGEGEAA